MDNKIGIWIDHRKAVIVFASPGKVTSKTVESAVQPHAHYSKRIEHSALGGQHDGGGEKKYEAHNGQQLRRYYDAVIRQLGKPESLLIFGPGEAKLQFRERLRRAKSLSQRVDGIETTDKLTNAQIVAKVKQHYGIQEDRMR